MMKLTPDVKAKLQDWRWRINNLYKIVDKLGNAVPMRENPIQRMINNCKKRRKLILKARQFGVTTNEIIKQLDFVSFHSNKTACILAHQQDTIETIFAKVRYAHRSIPDRLRPIPDRGGGSKHALYFPQNNSKIYCDLEVRGGTIHWLHISEAAFADPSRIKATLEAVPIDTGIVTFETTANGMGNHFYRKWIDHDPQYAKLFYPWFFYPDYRLDGTTVKELGPDEKELIERVKRVYGIQLSRDQIAFRRAKQKDLGELFAQEYAEDDVSCFLASGSAAMDLRLIKRLIDEAPEPIYDDGILIIYKEFDSHGIYACGADVAEGVGSDYSVGIMFEARSKEVVAMIRSNRWKPRAFAHQLYNLCRRYTKHERVWPLLGVERNNHGHAVLLELEDHLAYPNLYCYKSKSNGASEDVPGWLSNTITRPLMIDKFIDGVEEEMVTLNSPVILGECLTLIDNGGKIEAEDGEHDDCIIACAIGIEMCIEAAGSISLYDDLSTKILL